MKKVNTEVIYCDIVISILTFFLSVFPQDFVPASQAFQGQVGAGASGQWRCALLL